MNLYYALADRIADFSLDRMKQNVTLVNSDWTGAHVSRFLGITTHTLYPPVADPAPGAPWAERHNGFLAIGRISPEKEYERVMTILARVRERVPDRHADHRRHVGSPRAAVSRSAVRARAIARIVDRVPAQRQPRRASARLMATHRYGIHGMREEHFGMAPAELARAGCIVWVPRGGGQMEIVGHEPALDVRLGR